MTKEQIRKVALAIYNVSAAESDDGEHHPPTFDRLPPATKTVYEKMARAAIQAMITKTVLSFPGDPDLELGLSRK